MSGKNIVAQKGLVVKPPWNLRKSKRHEGRWYFFNTDSKESAWSLPEAFIQHDDSLAHEPDEPPPEVVLISSSSSNVQLPSLPSSISSDCLNDTEVHSGGGNGGWGNVDRYQRTTRIGSRVGSNDSAEGAAEVAAPVRPAPMLTPPQQSPLFTRQMQRNTRGGTQRSNLGKSVSVQCMGSSSVQSPIIPPKVKSPPPAHTANKNTLIPIESPSPLSPANHGGWGGGEKSQEEASSKQRSGFSKSQSTDSFRMSSLSLQATHGSLLGKETERLRLLSGSGEEMPHMPPTASESSLSSLAVGDTLPQLSPTLPRGNGHNQHSPKPISLESPRTELDSHSTYSFDSSESADDEGDARFKVTNGLGCGGYSVVVLVEDMETGHPYAMKVIQKARLTRSHDRRRIRNELKVLRTLAPCPFLEKCVSAFETKDRIFFVMEFNSGGDLFYHLVRRVNHNGTGFREDEVRTLLAEVMLGLEHMHSHGYVHRDIKVENIMLDSRGHVKLIDFGLVFELRQGRELKQDSLGEPMSPTGSLIYMAPELLQFRMGGRHTDWWALGVLAHELLTGRTPWSSLTNKKTIQKEITGMRVAPPAGLSPTAGMLICALLHQTPELRLGTTSSVRTASFFGPVDWGVAETGGLPPALPTSSSNVYGSGIGSTFDASETAEVLRTYLDGCEKEPAPGQCVMRVSAGRDPVPNTSLISLGLPRVAHSPAMLNRDRDEGLTWDEGEEDLRLRRSTSLTGDSTSWPSSPAAPPRKSPVPAMKDSKKI